MFRKGRQTQDAALAFRLTPSSTFLTNLYNGIFQRSGRCDYDSQCVVGDAATIFNLWDGFTLESAAHQIVYTKDWTRTVTYSLQSNMKVHYRAFFCTARCDIPYVSGVTNNMRSMAECYSSGFADQQAAVLGTSGAFLPGMDPFKNSRFCTNFKIRKVIKGVLTPTRRDLRLTAKLTKPCKHTWVKYVVPESAVAAPTGQIIVGRKGLFRGWLVVFDGEAVNDNTGSDMGPTLPVFSQAPFVIDVAQQSSFRVALVEENVMQFGSTGVEDDPVADLQHYNVYLDLAKTFNHNWNSYPVNA